MTRYEDALLDELRTAAVSAEDAAPARRPARRRALVGLAATGAAVAAITGTLVLGPTSGSPAYSLEQKPDGTYHLEIYDVSGIPAANERLAELGLRARVYEEKPQGGCPEFTWATHMAEDQSALVGGDLTGWTLKRDIPAGQSVLMTINQSPGEHPLWKGVSAIVIQGDPPPCVQAWHEWGPIQEPSAPTPTP